MASALRTPLLSWLIAAAITAGLGYPIVRFLPLYASIPLMIILTLTATFEGLFFGFSAWRHDVTPAAGRVIGAIMILALLSPVAITIFLFML